MTRGIIVCSRSSTLLDVEELLSNQRVSRVVLMDPESVQEGQLSENSIQTVSPYLNVKLPISEYEA
jgi:predicted transcriptional regulator